LYYYEWEKLKRAVEPIGDLVKSLSHCCCC